MSHFEETKQAVEQLAGRADAKIDGLQSRLETLESYRDRPAANDSKGSSDEREHKSKFLDWVRRPHDGMAKRVLEEAESEIQKKAITIGTDAGGGYGVPALIAEEIDRRVRDQNPFRQLVNVVTAGSSDYKKLISKNTAGSGWVGEGGSRSETSTSDLISAAPTWGTIYAYPKASEESMSDIFFDVGAWLAEEAGDAFAAAEAQAIWNGNGTNKPSGLINTTPATTDDTASPERAATALEYLPLTNGSPVALNADDLINLVYAVKTPYLTGPGVGWIVNRTTAREIRQLKDSQNQYLWERNNQAGQPEMLLGFPVFMSDVVDAATAGNFPICFGNFRRGYVLVDHAAGMRITVDDNISSPGQVKFYIRRREAGIVALNDALKVLKFADA